MRRKDKDERSAGLELSCPYFGGRKASDIRKIQRPATGALQNTTPGYGALQNTTPGYWRTWNIIGENFYLRCQCE